MELGNGNYSERDRQYWEASKEWYDNHGHTIKKSRSVIHVDFKKKKIIKGVSRDLKATINKKAA